MIVQERKVVEIRNLKAQKTKLCPLFKYRLCLCQRPNYQHYQHCLQKFGDNAKAKLLRIIEHYESWVGVEKDHSYFFSGVYLLSGNLVYTVGVRVNAHDKKYLHK